MEAERAQMRLQEQHARHLAGLNLNDTKLLQDPALLEELEDLRPKVSGSAYIRTHLWWRTCAPR
jgi:hypothetical protein